MVERWGPRRIDEIEKEPPKEAPIRSDPGDDIGLFADHPDDTTRSDVGDDLGELDEETMFEPLLRMEPMGPGDKEAERWNTEADAIEDWAEEVSDPKAYRQDVLRRMYEPSEAAEDATPPDVGDDLGRLDDEMTSDSDAAASDVGQDAVGSDTVTDVDQEP